MEKTIEKMKRRQDMMDGKLDELIAQLSGTEGGCGGSDKFALINACSPNYFNCAV